MRAMRVVLRALVLFGAMALAAVGTLAYGFNFMPRCLGPLGVTPIQCLAAYIAEHPRFLPGPEPVLAPILGVAFLLALVGVGSASLLRLPSIVRLTAAAGLGAVVGLVVYELAMPRTVGGVTSTGEWITVTFGWNAAARDVAVVVGAGMALLLVAVFIGVRHDSRPVEPRRPGVVALGSLSLAGVAMLAWFASAAGEPRCTAAGTVEDAISPEQGAMVRLLETTSRLGPNDCR